MAKQECSFHVTQAQITTKISEVSTPELVRRHSCLPTVKRSWTRFTGRKHYERRRECDFYQALPEIT